MSDILTERKRLGSKGEILPSKRLRERLGLRPGAPIEIKVEEDALIVKPAPDPLKELEGILDTGLTVKDLKRAAENQVVKEAAEKLLKQS